MHQPSNHTTLDGAASLVAALEQTRQAIPTCHPDVPEAVLSVERCQVEPVDHIHNEPGQVPLRQPVAQVRGQQERLLAIAAQELSAMAAGYCGAA